MKLTDVDGVTLPQRRGAVGHLKAKGASVIERYFGTDESALDDERYLDAGDLASIDVYRPNPSQNLSSRT